ncbi:hypothetical protein GCM10022221_47750 [Actinocorallia aurea]
MHLKIIHVSRIAAAAVVAALGAAALPAIAGGSAASAARVAALTLTKSADTTRITGVGQIVQYTFAVANSGDEQVTAVLVSDPLLPVLTCVNSVGGPLVNGSFSLAPAATASCTARYTVTAADIESGDELSNTGHVAGTDPNGRGVQADSNTLVIPIVEDDGALSITKSAEPLQVPGAGSVVTYTFSVTNTGDEQLTEGEITDSRLPGSTVYVCTGPNGRDFDNGAIILDPADTVECTAEYTVTAADAAAGTITNTATATAEDPAGQTVTDVSEAVTVRIAAAPGDGLTLRKSVTPHRVHRARQRLRYTLRITNTGTTVLNDVSVRDSRVATDEFTCRIADGPRQEPGEFSLQPGQTAVCTARYRVTRADLRHRVIRNRAQATAVSAIAGRQVRSNVATAVVRVAHRRWHHQHWHHGQWHHGQWHHRPRHHHHSWLNDDSRHDTAPALSRQ